MRAIEQMIEGRHNVDARGRVSSPNAHLVLGHCAPKSDSTCEMAYAAGEREHAVVVYHIMSSTKAPGIYAYPLTGCEYHTCF